MPKVLAWSSTSSNSVDAEYILMEEAAGIPLEKIWKDDKDTLTKVKVVENVVELQRKLLSVSFNR